MLCNEFVRLSNACLDATAEQDPACEQVERHLISCPSCASWTRENAAASLSPLAADLGYSAAAVPPIDERSLDRWASAGRSPLQRARSSRPWVAIGRYAFAMGATALIVLSLTQRREPATPTQSGSSPNGPAHPTAAVQSQLSALQGQVTALTDQNKLAAAQFERDKRSLQERLSRSESQLRNAQSSRRDAVSRSRMLAAALADARRRQHWRAFIASASLNTDQSAGYGFPESLAVRSAGPRTIGFSAQLSRSSDIVAVQTQPTEETLFAVYAATADRIVARVYPRGEAAWERAGEPVAIRAAALAGTDRLVIVAVQATLDDEAQTSSRRVFSDTKDARSLVRALFDHPSQPRLAVVQVSLRR